ncbi:Forkhead box protein N1 [Ooceraea biroi]|nr:Forkhead box protein N1 [Ooceraea biroi]
MEQGSSKDPWISRDCLFDSDTLQEIFHMDIRCCNNTDRFDCSDLGFDFGDVLALEETEEDLIGFNDSRNRNLSSNLKELNHLDEFSDDDDLASTLVNLNSVLPRNLSVPVRSPVLDSERPILETVNVESTGENDEEETENESERTENDGESEEEEEEEVENEENEHNETEYETEEESQEDEGEEEEEEMEGDEQDAVARRRSFTPSSMEALTISSSSMVGDNRSLTASSPTVQLMRVHMQHPKMNTVSGMVKLHDIKTLAANSSGQISQHIRKQIYNNNVHDVNSDSTTMMIQTTKRDKNLAGHRDNPYPKPAYSYSCLIAMALKNSRTGSLPVSEIYNFMCRHFPYFKTAPNGWKNSVRHNLSLNKCFEKIEKPPGNGSQRKGCLWAIHPSKVAKMDEEVRKWSRKDPIAIKQAMVHPDHLELLERGDMKYENDRHEEIYEDADSYVGSEVEGSAGDEIIENINDEENAVQETEKLNRKHIDTIDDDIIDDDIIVEQFYDEFDIENATDNDTLLDTRLNVPKQKQPFMYELVSCAKRQKTLLSSSIQSDYIYQQIDASSRRKTHLVALRPGTAPTSESFRGSS